MSPVYAPNSENSRPGRHWNYIHLVDADLAADPDVVLPTIHVERIGDGVNVGAALKGRKSTITQRPVTAKHLGRCQTATHTRFGRLGYNASRSVRAVAVDVSAGNADDCGFARAGAERENMVKNPAESEAGLVDGAIREKVCFRQCNIATMVVDVLVAAEGIDFSIPVSLPAQSSLPDRS